MDGPGGKISALLGPLPGARLGFGLGLADDEYRMLWRAVGRSGQPGDPVRAVGLAADLERTVPGGHRLGHRGFIL